MVFWLEFARLDFGSVKNLYHKAVVYNSAWQGRRTPWGIAIPEVLHYLHTYTMSSTPNTKDEFYENVASIINNIPSKEQFVILGDFQPAVRACWCGQGGCEWIAITPAVHILQHVHRQHLLQDKAPKQGFLRHPRSKHWHQLDMILVKHTILPNVVHTHSYHSADGDTGHTLVARSSYNQGKLIALNHAARSKDHQTIRRRASG